MLDSYRGHKNPSFHKACSLYYYRCNNKKYLTFKKKKNERKENLKLKNNF